jgi:hypothetical protein
MKEDMEEFLGVLILIQAGYALFVKDMALGQATCVYHVVIFVNRMTKIF